MVKFKFKVGDKVRILPSALNVHVPEDEINKIGIIMGRDIHSKYNKVLMDKIRTRSGYRVDWLVSDSQIEPAIKVGQQLLFKFME